MVTRIVVCIFLASMLAGCATSRKHTSGTEVEELQSRVSDLESQLQQKEEEVRNLEQELNKSLGGESGVYAGGDSALTKATPKRIQKALKNAGFYSGPVDGKIGKRTRKAIKEFQKANGLNSDGVVGQKTWEKLRKYFE